jgi:type VI secretion system secreted protein Hcp
MSTIAYLTMTGVKQGAIKGGVTIKGREGAIPVTAISSEIASAIDPTSGAVTGKRQHRPLTITKPIDQASPKLYAAMVTNETLSDVTITSWAPSPDGSGTQIQSFTIKLTNARLVGITLASSDTQDSEVQTELRFTYQKITWTWVDGEITAEDDWTTAA